MLKESPLQGEQQTPPKAISIKRNMLFNTVGSLMYQGCLWLTTVLVVTLSHGYGDSGVYAFAMSVGNMFSAVSTYSMRTYQVSDLAGKYSQENYVGFRILTIALGFVALGAYSVFVSPDAATLISIFIYLLFRCDESFCDVLYGVDQRGERMDYIGISQFIRGIAVVVAFAAGMALLGSLDAAIALMFPACLLVTVLWDIPHASRFAPIKPQIGFTQAKSLLVECLPMVLGTLFLGAIVSVARQYYGNMAGSEALGIYAAVATPAVLIQAGARYLYAPALVPLARQWEDDRNVFAHTFRKSLVLMVVAVIAMVALLTLAGPWFFHVVYGPSIAESVYLFRDVLIGTGLTAVLWYVFDVLVVCRDMRGALISAAVALVTSLVLMIPLEDAFDMSGINYTVIAACASGVVVGLVGLWCTVRKSSAGDDCRDE